MKHHSFTFLFLFLAIDSYFMGVIAGVAMFVALALMYEAMMWFGASASGRASVRH